jgi:hypothetical protein
MTDRAEIYRKEIEQLLQDQNEIKGAARTQVCPYDGQFCGAPMDLNCQVPIFLGEGHDKIIGFAGPCPRKKRRCVS